jgi:NADH-quinone oxidoreductase subunit B
VELTPVLQRKPAVVRTAHGPVALIDLPLACCGLESSRASLPVDEADPVAVALCISGTVTAKFAPVVEQAVASAQSAYPDIPLVVIAVGVCAASGGPYWDSPSVKPGYPVDLVVPGCPPSPEAIGSALNALAFDVKVST